MQYRLLILAFLFSVPLASGAGIQHHPFQELYPPDQDLGFGGYDVRNASLVETKYIDRNESSDAVIIRNGSNNMHLAEFNQSGKVKIPNGDLNMDTNDLLNVRGIRRESSSYPNIFLGSNTIDVNLHGDGSGSFRVYDKNVGQPIFKASEGGPVEVKNADLDIASDGKDLRFETSGGGTDQFVRWYEGGNQKFSIGYQTGSDRLLFKDQANSERKFLINQNGPVEVKNANLDVSGNINITDNGVLQADGADSGIQFFDNGNVQVQLEDSSNDVFQVNNDGSTTYFRIDRGGPVKVKNSNLNMNGNSLNNADDVETNDIYDDDSSSLRVQDNIDLNGRETGTMFTATGGDGGYNGLDVSMDDDNSNNDYGLRVRFEDSSSFDTSGDVAFTVQPNENSPKVGIDTNSPSSTLDVNGASDFRGNLDINANNIQSTGGEMCIGRYC